MWRDDAYVLDMLLYARKSRDFNLGVGLERFASDSMLQAATMHVLQIVGEAAGKVSAECRNAHPEIAWDKIINLRHRLVHDYPRIELPKLWNIVQNHIPGLIEALEPMVPPDSS
jgi:uncharacterized protein with HEPN domain